ncbi:emerin isoform 1-T2 [Discoglossus pictus]
MEEYKRMSDEELINTLKQYGLSHGPVVGTTRTLYEKRLYEFESKKSRNLPSSGSYDKKQYDLPSRESYSSRTYEADDVGDDHYQETYTVTKTFADPTARQRIKGDDFQNRDQKSYSYHSVSHVRPSYSSSQNIEPRKPIREKQKEEISKNRIIPLWLQLLLLFFIIGFLAYVYFFVQETHDNPFKHVDN